MSRSKSAPGADAGADAPDFVSRWSRLKHEARQAGDSAAVADADHAVSADSAGPNEPASAPQPTDADMPSLDSLTYDSDYSDFLSPGVSEQLRKLALRKLFHNDVFNIRDGLDEYDDDFTHFEKLGDIVTSDMRHQMEMEARRRAEQLLEDESPSPDANSIEAQGQPAGDRAAVDSNEAGVLEDAPVEDQDQARRADTQAPARIPNEDNDNE